MPTRAKRLSVFLLAALFLIECVGLALPAQKKLPDDAIEKYVVKDAYSMHNLVTGYDHLTTRRYDYKLFYAPEHCGSRHSPGLKYAHFIVRVRGRTTLGIPKGTTYYSCVGKRMFNSRKNLEADYGFRLAPFVREDVDMELFSGLIKPAE